MVLNQFTGIGNLTRDPESRVTQTGASVCKMGLALNRTTGSGENRKSESIFIDLECWGKTAELCQQYLRKGSQILVQGRLKMDEYETQDGRKVQKILIVAENIKFGQKPKS